MRTFLFCAAIPLVFCAASTAMAACTDPAAPGVDWSGCDLQQANPGPVDLTGVILSGAIWVDGSTCAEGSVGQCEPAQRVMSGMGGLAYSN